MGGVLALLALLTLSQNRVWTDDVRLWQNAARFAPLKPRPFINLGRALEAAGDDAGAEAAYLRAADLSYAQRKDSIPFAFAYSAAHTNLAHLYAKYGRYQVALYHLDGVLTEQPLFPVALFNKSVVLSKLGHCDQAIASWTLARSMEPTLPGRPC